MADMGSNYKQALVQHPVARIIEEQLQVSQ